MHNYLDDPIWTRPHCSEYLLFALQPRHDMGQSPGQNKRLPTRARNHELVISLDGHCPLAKWACSSKAETMLC